MSGEEYLSQLVLPGVQAHQGGMYVCLIFSVSRTVEVSGEEYLSQLVMPGVQAHQGGMYVCLIFYVSRTVELSGEEYLSQLVLPGVQAHQAGMYVCLVTTPAGGFNFQPSFLTVAHSKRFVFTQRRKTKREREEGRKDQVQQKEHCKVFLESTKGCCSIDSPKLLNNFPRRLSREKCKELYCISELQLTT